MTAAIQLVSIILKEINLLYRILPPPLHHKEVFGPTKCIDIMSKASPTLAAWKHALIKGALP